MKTFDASAIVYGWDNYPIGTFPKVWGWLAAEIAAGDLTIPETALAEVEHNSPDCHAWLVNEGITVLAVTQAIAQEALRIKTVLGVVNDRYHPKGVDENDIIIVATSKEHSVPLISEEGRQQQRPVDKRRYKIPAVCSDPAVNVTCVDFLDLILEANRAF